MHFVILNVNPGAVITTKLLRRDNTAHSGLPLADDAVFEAQWFPRHKSNLF
jgi:hypothetical protein